MELRKVNIIAIQERYLDIITKQVKEILGDKIIINSITVKDLQKNTVTNEDIVVISNSQIKGLVTQLIPENCPIVIAKRDINYTNTKKLLNLPPGQQILVVNDNKSNTEETVQSLKEIVFEHNYQAYVPEETISNTVDYIVTPGEQHLLPKSLSNVIDIGYRLLSISTFEEIIDLLEINYQRTQIIKRYFKACVSLSGNGVTQTNNNKDIRNVAQYHFEDIIAVSNPMKDAVALAKKYSRNETISHIHIDGETGTGKSMFAQAIHNYSNLAELPFISTSCVSKPFDHVEKELFGSEIDEEISYGLFELAKYGTVCIKDVWDLPLSLQKRLYQVLKTGEFSRLASSEVIPLQSRVITTSSKNSRELEKGLICSDLYRLLTKYSLEVPALAERLEDFSSLIDNIKQRINRSDILFTNEVIDYLKSHDWERNVKELYNVITYLAFLEEAPIGMDSLPFYLRSKANEKKFNDIEIHTKIISKIEEHGFLDESIEILNTFYEGKKVYNSYGRKALKKHLEKKGLSLSEQQLRMRLEVLQELDLTIVRQGRAGTTISRKGEEFLKGYFKNKITRESKELDLKIVK
ncbi:sigma 54-interacting transcriptional regulator [Virgibacillus sp. YIM 98842]|uniref:sigma 54-interacting transcriptional regulator n=1 Tax=Virgibacillus sp. YIM 98842 TaxID=2663533 RepID=UPI0013DA0B91|nr:sigma 54-interacting transcriptional regulator [Virgibacillus sp. YIM 98842]